MSKRKQSTESPKKQKKAKRDYQIISSIADSSDEEYEENDMDVLNENLNDKKLKYPVSYILTEIGNSILLSKGITDEYMKRKDPVTFAENRLREELALKKNHSSYEERVKEIETELNIIKELKEDRINLHEKFKGATRFIPRRLSKNFVDEFSKLRKENFSQDTEHPYDRVKVTKYMQKKLHYLQTNNDNTFLPKELTKMFHISSSSKWDAQRTEIIKKIRGSIGDDSTSDIKDYIEWMHEKETSPEIQKKIITSLKESIFEDLDNIYRVTEQCSKYRKDQSYSVEVKKLPFLVQLRSGRKHTRDTMKDDLTLLSELELGSDFPLKRNAVIGFNTSTQMWSSRKLSHFTGSGTYEKLGGTMPWSEYKKILQQPYESLGTREKELHSLLQVEAMRSTTSLLTSSMFCELATENYKKYQYKSIHSKFPMAMGNAVDAATLVESSFSDKLCSRLTYDYRTPGQGHEGNAATFEKKNKKILGDYLCYKSGSFDEGGEYEYQCDFKDEGNGYAEYGGYRFILDKGDSLVGVSRFPTKVLHGLIKDTYDVDLPYLESGTVILDKEVDEKFNKALEISSRGEEEKTRSSSDSESVSAESSGDLDDDENLLMLDSDEERYLKRVGKNMLSPEDKDYNLKEAFFYANKDNPELLNKLVTESVVAADIDLKAIKVKKNVDQMNYGIVSFIGENHVTDHEKNVNNLVKDIIKNEDAYKSTAICMERKSYGKNLGVPDAILISNVLEHNEKNPDNQINIPEEITKKSLIYHDAVLYKTAREKKIPVIGLEGKNLKVGKEHKDYNKTREEYMAKRINHVKSKGYNVVAQVGSAHVEPLKQLTQNDPKNIAVSIKPNLKKQNSSETHALPRTAAKKVDEHGR